MIGSDCGRIFHPKSAIRIATTNHDISLLSNIALTTSHWNYNISFSSQPSQNILKSLFSLWSGDFLFPFELSNWKPNAITKPFGMVNLRIIGLILLMSCTNLKLTRSGKSGQYLHISNIPPVLAGHVGSGYNGRREEQKERVWRREAAQWLSVVRTSPPPNEKSLSLFTKTACDSCSSCQSLQQSLRRPTVVFFVKPSPRMTNRRKTLFALNWDRRISLLLNNFQHC